MQNSHKQAIIKDWLKVSSTLSYTKLCGPIKNNIYKLHHRQKCKRTYTFSYFNRDFLSWLNFYWNPKNAGFTKMQAFGEAMK